MRTYTYDIFRDLKIAALKDVAPTESTIFRITVKVDVKLNSVELWLEIYNKELDQSMELEFETGLPPDKIPDAAVSFPYLLKADSDIENQLGKALGYYLSKSATLEIEYEDKEEIAFYLIIGHKQIRAAAPPAKVKKFIRPIARIP